LPASARTKGDTRPREGRVVPAEREREGQLVERARRGDARAYRILVEAHQTRIHHLALGLVRDEQDALELVQEAFFRAWRSLDRFNQGSSFYTWVYRILTNLAIDLLRRPQRRETSLEELPESFLDDNWLHRPASVAEDPLTHLQRAELAAQLVEALDALPSYHRAVIVMRELDGLSYSEMASVAGVSKGTIMSRLFHARQKLQRSLAPCLGAAMTSPKPDEAEYSSVAAE